MERVAIPVWQGRVSPVLDTAERLWIYDLGSGQESPPPIVEIPPTDIRQRTQFIRDLGIRTLLCGAVSRPLYSLLLGARIAVWPWLTGTAEEVLAAYSDGCLDSDRFQLPGCRRRRQRGHFMRDRSRRGKGRRNREPL
jgi:predicted Fe-Mo cluster-binding NifX family protein